jgi:serine/threonine-protein kinase
MLAMYPATQPSPKGLVGLILRATYRLERLIGAGAMGAVYETSDAAGSRFATKVMLPQVASEEARKRFLREAKICGNLNSRHLVQVIDMGEEPDGLVYLVMPLLTGFDLAGLLERSGPLAPATAVRLVLQACAGLGVAHKAGVVHRDIKPSNLFVHHRPDGEIVVHVCDFGVAKRADIYDESNLTRTGTSLGSPLYMSPEQILSAKDVDHRTDIWSLGVTLYELLCGSTPQGDALSFADLMLRIAWRNAPSIQMSAPWVAPELALVGG